MSYCCLVPLYRYRINYTIASGEAFTEIDRFVLRAIYETRDWTLTRLEKRLCLPPRLLIETVVGLAKRGYVGLSGGSQPSMRVTALGLRMITDQQLPVSVKLHHDRSDVFVERLTGHILLRNDLTYTTQRSLSARGIIGSSVPILTEQQVAAPDLGQVHAMLSRTLDSRDSREWIYSIDIAPAASEPHFLPLDVEPLSEAVINLPFSLYHLREPVLKQLKQRLKENENLVESSYFHRSPHTNETSATAPPTTEAGLWTEILVDEKQYLLFGNHRHEEYLREVLTEHTRVGSYVLIASAFLDTYQLEPKIRGWILEAMRRGAHIEILWGYEAYSERRKENEAIDWLRQLQEEAGKLNNGGSLSFNERRTGSHAKLLIHGWGDTFSACIGSYNWLSTRSVTLQNPNDYFNISFITDNPGLVAELCLSVASLWENVYERGISPQVQHWRTFAQHFSFLATKANEGGQIDEVYTTDYLPVENLASEVEIDRPQIKLKVIHNYEHESRLRDFLRTYKQRCAVVSHTFNTAGTIRLTRFAGPREEHRPPPIICYGESMLAASEMVELEAIIKTAGIELRQEAHLHSKIAIADDRVMVSSYNFLAAQTSTSSFGLREIGLFIEGAEIADVLWKKLCS